MIYFLTEHFSRLWAIGALPILLPLVLYGWHRRQITIKHSSLAPHSQMRRRLPLLQLAAYLALGNTIVGADLTLMGPRQPAAIVEHIEQKRNVCLAGDRSGSMLSILLEGVKDLDDSEAKATNDPSAKTVDNGGSDKIIIQSPTNGPAPSEDMQTGKATRVDAMYKAMRYMIRNRMSDNPEETDRYCMFTFDTETYTMAPLSTSKQVLMLRTVHLKENVGGGTNFFGPSSSGGGVGPLQKALDFFEKYTTRDSVNVIIIITDGNDGGDPVRIQQLIALYKEAHLRLYVIGLGEGWTPGNNLDLQKFADAINATDSTNGRVFSAKNPGQMAQAIETISSLQKSQEKIFSVQTYEETPFWFLLGTAVSAVLFVFFTLLTRRLP